MTNLYLTSAAADSAVTAGSGTKWRADTAPGASTRHLNKNSVAGPTAPLQVTDGATAGTDGTVVSWYSPPLSAVTIAGQIVCSLWDRENATANNVAPTIRIERCDGTGAVLSTIVSETTNHGAGEMPTTAGGNNDTITCTAANVTDTALSDGDRLRITLWIDDAAGQGGVGNMAASGGRGEFWVNGPNGASGQSQIAFTESVIPLGSPWMTHAESTRGVTNPQTATFTGALNGDTIYVFAGGDGGLGGGNDVTAVALTTTAGSTGSWAPLNEQLTAGAGNDPWVGLWKATVTADGTVTVSVNKTQAGTQRNWHMWGLLVKSTSTSGTGDVVATTGSGSSTQALSVPVDDLSAVAFMMADWDAGSVGTPTPGGAVDVEATAGPEYTERSLYWVAQAAGTRNYGVTGASGADMRCVAVEILAAAAGTTHSADASLTGTGTTTTAGTSTKPASASLTGTGSRTAVASGTKPVGASLTGTGSFTSSASVTKPIAGSLTGTGSFTADGTVGAAPVTAEATLTGTGTLTGTATSAKPAAASLAGTGAITGTADSTKPAAATLTGTGSCTATVATTKPAAASLTGTASLTSAAASTKPAASLLTGTATFTAEATVGAAPVAAQATLTGTGTCTAEAERVRSGAANLTGVGSLTASAAVVKPSTAMLIGIGAFAAGGAKTVTVGASLLGFLDGDAAAQAVEAVTRGGMTAEERSTPDMIPAHAGSPTMSPTGRSASGMTPTRWATSTMTGGW